MDILSIWRVYRTKAECVWAGPIRCSTPEIGYGEFLDDLISEHLVVPKQFAGKVAGHLETHSTEGAKMCAAYPASYHHAAAQEFGLGLAISDPDKWTKEWPQFQWEVLETVSRFGSSYTTVKYEWSIEQLAGARRKRHKRPGGLDQKVWDMLGVLRK